MDNSKGHRQWTTSRNMGLEKVKGHLEEIKGDWEKIKGVMELVNSISFTAVCFENVLDCGFRVG